MSQPQQLVLPGMPIRIIVSAVWESADRPCTVRATVDVPSDQFASTMEGSDLSGLMTFEELRQVMEDMLITILDSADPTC